MKKQSMENKNNGIGDRSTNIHVKNENNQKDSGLDKRERENGKNAPKINFDEKRQMHTTEVNKNVQLVFPILPEASIIYDDFYYLVINSNL